MKLRYIHEFLTFEYLSNPFKLSIKCLEKNLENINEVVGVEKTGFLPPILSFFILESI